MLIQIRKKRNTNTIKEKYKSEEREIEKEEKKIKMGGILIQMEAAWSGTAWSCVWLGMLMARLAHYPSQLPSLQ